MKVNFHINLKEFDGTDAVEEKKVMQDGRVVTVKSPVIINDLVGKALYNGGGLEPAGKADTDNDYRFKAYKLCQKIIASTGEIDLSPEELVMVKQAATIYSAAGVYAQIVELVDPEK